MLSTSAFQLRRFRVLWVAATISGVGEFVYAVAAAWLMLTLTDSTAWVGAVVAARILPILVITPLAGALADAWDRRTILLVAHACMFGIALFLAVSTGLGVIRPLQLLLVVSCLGVATAFNMPAWLAFLPDIVPARLIPSAVSLQALAASFAAALGPPLGGALLAVSSPAWVFAANGLTYIPVFVVILWLATPTRPRALTSVGFALGTMRRELRGRNYGGPFLAAACFAFASGAVAATLPSLANDFGGAHVYGALLGISGVGTIAGALARGRLQRRLGGWLVPLVLALEGLAILVVGVRSALVVVGAGMFLAGVFGLLGGATLEAAVQLVTSPDSRGRVMSVYLFVFLSALALSSLLVGAAATVVGSERALSAAGLLVSTLAIAHFARRGAGSTTPRHPVDPEGSALGAIVGRTR